MFSLASIPMGLYYIMFDSRIPRTCPHIPSSGGHSWAKAAAGPTHLACVTHGARCHDCIKEGNDLCPLL